VICADPVEERAQAAQQRRVDGIIVIASHLSILAHLAKPCYTRLAF
jgi:hypothetical protein